MLSGFVPIMPPPLLPKNATKKQKKRYKKQLKAFKKVSKPRPLIYFFGSVIFSLMFLLLIIGGLAC